MKMLETRILNFTGSSTNIYLYYCWNFLLLIVVWFITLMSSIWFKRDCSVSVPKLLLFLWHGKNSNVNKILLVIYQNKPKNLGNNRKFRVQLREEVSNKLFKHRIWWNWLKLSDKWIYLSKWVFLIPRNIFRQFV